MSKFNKTSIVILTHNKLELTKECVDSIKEYTTDVPYEIIIVDNNSTDGTVEWLKEQNNIKVLYNDENLGFPKGCNQGINLAEIDNDILLLNNDVIVTKNWLKNMQIALYSQEDIGSVGCVTNNCSNYQQINVSYNNIAELHDFASSYNISNPKLWNQCVRLVGYCMLIKRQALNKVGLLEEAFSPGNYEDDDYSLRLILADYKLLLCKDVFIHHYGHSTFDIVPESLAKAMKNNESKFKEKWGFLYSYSAIKRYDILKMIERHPDDKFRVLEIGCGCGNTILEIKNTYKNAEVFGVEIDDIPAKIASTFATVINTDIEKGSLDYPEQYFDYIIFGDVLEHLRDPWKIVNDFKPLLKNQGSLITSLPNIMHYSIIWNLLSGKWDYTDSGILDKTHLRFFTLESMIDMLTKAGYEVNDIAPTTPFPENEKIDKLVNMFTSMTSKEMEVQYKTYQYIISAKKR